MEYESVILKRLIDTYGVVGNPRYISEIIKEFIVQGKERYPELFTYQADWLAHIDEFGLNPSYTVSYTGQSIYAPNTLQRPVKSAILTGSTKYRDIDTGEILDVFDETKNLELVSVKTPVLTTTGKNLIDYKNYNLKANEAQNPQEIIVDEQGLSFNVDTTRWKSLWYDLYLESGEKYTLSYNTNLLKCFIFKSKVDAYVSSELVADATVIGATEDKIQKVTKTFTAPSTGFIRIRLTGEQKMGNHILQNFQIEKGLTATSYEPHKSNILTVNEEVTLRGVGDVKDTLDCLSGKITERIKEIVMDGNEDWENQVDSNWNNSTHISFRVKISDMKINMWGDGKTNCISDKFKTIALDNISYKKSEEFIGSDGSMNHPMKLNIKILRSRLNGNETLEGFKQWLSQNPITVQYELATPVIKTVDLTILDQNGQNVKQLMSFNGGTHFNTGSLEGSLIPSVSVTVETDLGETLKVCSLEGNTM